MIDKNISLNEVLLKRVLKKYVRENQPVTVTPITVNFHSQFTSKGEFYKARRGGDVVERLNDHINLMMQFASLHHFKKNLEPATDSSPQFKENKRNDITLLGLNEFSLYTHGKPLTAKEFARLIDKIEDLAKKNPANLHLLLGSIALEHNNEVLNVNLYVQCGSVPKINSYTKVLTADDDCLYDGSSMPYQAYYPLKDKPFTRILLSDKTDTTLSISHDPLVHIKTAGGAEYTVAIDCCFDHVHQYAYKMYAENRHMNHSELLTSQICHLVVSNYIDPHPQDTFGAKLVSFDPVRGGVYIDHKKQNELQSISRNLAVTALFKKLETIYHGLEIVVVNCTELKVKNPPFGPNYTFKINEALTLGK